MAHTTLSTVASVDGSSDWPWCWVTMVLWANLWETLGEPEPPLSMLSCPCSSSSVTEVFSVVTHIYQVLIVCSAMRQVLEIKCDFTTEVQYFPARTQQ